ncbi:MAG: HD domain-containing protein [Spirochaetes bacterium]|nr:HD domain-containing protein [Spirochaetota bacterium]
MNLTEIADIFDKLIDHDSDTVNDIIKVITRKIYRIFDLRWAVLYLIPEKEYLNLQEFMAVSHKVQERFFNLQSRQFRKTLLFQVIQKKETSKCIKKSTSHPEFRKSDDLYAYRIRSKKFSIGFEFSIDRSKTIRKEELSKFLGLVVRIIDKKHRDEKADKKITELGDLIEVSKILNSTLNLDTLLNRLFGEVRNIMRSEGCSLMLKSRKTGELKFRTVKGLKSNIIKEFTIPAGKGIAGWIVRNKKPVLVNDVSKDYRFYSGMDQKSGFKTRNLIGAPLIFNNEVTGIIEAVNKVNNENFDETDKEVFVSLANLAAIALQNATYYRELQDLFLNTAKSLSAAIDAKDPYTKGHSERVTKYAIMLAKELKCDQNFIRLIEWSGSLHDIGKIGISEAILMKPGQLNNDEYNIIKGHPEIGESILKPIRELEEILPGIRNHHEKWDGTGYPDGLKKQDIPLMARIIALGDTYDAMTSNRPYRKKVQMKIALAEVNKCSGTQFDPYLAKIFVKMMKRSREE